MRKNATAPAVVIAVRPSSRTAAAGPSAALAPRRYKLTVVSLDEWQGPSKQAYKITPAFLSYKEAGHSVISPAGVIVDANVGSLILDELKSFSKLTAS